MFCWDGEWGRGCFLKENSGEGMTGVGVGSDRSRVWVELKGVFKGYWSIRLDRKVTI